MLSLCFLQVPLEKSSIQHLASRIQYDTRPRLRYGQLGFPASCLRKIQNLVSSVQHLESSMILDPDYVMVSLGQVRLGYGQLGFPPRSLRKNLVFSVQYLVSRIQYDTRPRLRYGQLRFPASPLRKIQYLVFSMTLELDLTHLFYNEFWRLSIKASNHLGLGLGQVSLG